MAPDHVLTARTAAGDEPSAIAESYAASETLLVQAPPCTGPAATAATAASAASAALGAHGARGAAGVDWSALRGSPPEAIGETFEWIRREHGAIDTFLESVGCDDAWRRMLLNARRL